MKFCCNSRARRDRVQSPTRMQQSPSQGLYRCGVTDQISGKSQAILLDSTKSHQALLAVVAEKLVRPVQRAFLPDGEEIDNLPEKLEKLKHGDDGELDGEVVVTDGSDFKFKYGDHHHYQFGDLLLKPLARKIHPKHRDIIEPPQPPTVPLAGNLHDIGTDAWKAFFVLEEKYGPLLKLRIFNDVIYVCADPETVQAVAEIQDKRLPTETFGMKTMACQGVFIADGQQWEFARHEFQQCLTPELLEKLIPHFAGMAMKAEASIVSQGLLSKPIDAMNWIERITYDVICTVGFDYDPKMIEATGDKKEPFIEVFDELLEISINAALYGALDFTGRKRKLFKEKTEFLNKSLDEMIGSARAKGSGTSILHHLLSAKCPLTGLGFNQSELRDQLITMLVAGHKTTTLLLTWSLWHLAANADVEMKLIKELREVFADDMHRVPTADDLRKLTYLDKIIKETLRLASPVQVAQRGLTQPVEAGQYTLLPGGHKGRGNSWVAIHVMGISHSKKYWGEDALEFDPDRFDPEKMKSWHPNQYVPFGGGRRLCIGNLFAITQAKVALSMLLRKYSFRTVPGKDLKLDPSDIATPLSAEKGGGVWLRFHKRDNWDEVPAPTAGMNAGRLIEAQHKQVLKRSKTVRGDALGQRMLVVWGGEFGTTHKIADNFRNAAEKVHFDVTLKACDEVTSEELAGLSTDTVLVVFMATYNGHPPKNAASFVTLFESAAKADNQILEGRRYVVLGLGNSNWISTFAKVGKKVDELLERCGGERVLPLEIADKNSTFEETALSWRYALFTTLGDGSLEVVEKSFTDDASRYEAPASFLSLEGDTTTDGEVAAQEEWYKQTLPAFLQHLGFKPSEMLENKEICGKAPDFDPYRSVRQISIALPEGSEYECGDHLAVMPRLPKEMVSRVCNRLQVSPKAVVIPRSSRPEAKQDKVGHWAVGKRIVVEDLIAFYCDLNITPSREALAAFAEVAQDKSEKTAIQVLLSTNAAAYDAWCERHLTFIDALEEWKSVQISLARLVEVTNRIEPRLYSIASSPKVAPNSVELCCGIVRYDVKGAARYGLCSTMLAATEVDENVLCKIQKAPYMRLPTDTSAPIACVCGGTGLAPFYGFLHQRAHEKSEGASVGLVTLYFGCRGDYDYLHSEQLQKWESEGICKLSISFSRKPGTNKEYVYHALERDGEDLRTLLSSSSKGCLYVCGSASTLAKSSTRVLEEVFMNSKPTFAQLQEEGRVVLDVWG